MSIDDEKYNLPAVRGDAAGIALNASIGFQAALSCILALSRGEKPDDKDIDRIKHAAEVLEKRFDSLSGWTDD